MQEGDRVLSVNDQSLESMTLDEVNTLLRESGKRAELEVEFDVAGSYRNQNLKTFTNFKQYCLSVSIAYIHIYI